MTWLESSLYYEGVSLRNLARDELYQRGLLLSPEEFIRTKNSLVLKGNNLYQGPFRVVIGNPLFELSNSILRQVTHSLNPDSQGITFLKGIPLILAIGYEFGLEFSRLLGCDKRASKRAAWTCALGNVMVSLIDIFLDDMPVLFPAAVSLSFAEYSKMFPTTQQPKSTMIDRDLIHNPFLNIFRRTIETFRRRIKYVCRIAPRYLMEEFKTTLKIAIVSEIPTDFGDFSPAMRCKAVYEYLRRRNSLPSWASCLICMLYSQPQKIESLGSWKELLLKFGDIFWIVDDIADLAEDLRARRWNYLLLRLAEVSGSSLAEEPPRPECHREIYTGILQNNLVTSGIEQLSLNLEALRTHFQQMRKSSVRISKLVSFQICRHICSRPA